MKYSNYILQENFKKVHTKNLRAYSQICDRLTHATGWENFKKTCQVKSVSLSTADCFTQCASSKEPDAPLDSMEEDETSQHCPFGDWLLRKCNNRSDLRIVMCIQTGISCASLCS